MSYTLRTFLCLSLVASSFCPVGALALSGKEKAPIEYPESGKVIANPPKRRDFYQIETVNALYLLQYTKTTGFHLGSGEFNFNGKPVEIGDTVQFRVEGEWAYIPAANGEEGKLQIFTAELKTIPPAAPSPVSPSASGQSTSRSAPEAIVTGSGIHIMGQKQVGWSTNPSSVGTASFSAPRFAPPIAAASPSAPVIATGPVMAIPATGGAPVLVTPTGPVGGGVVTGIPVTGGAPIVGIPTGPVMGAPMGAPRPGGGGGGGPRWVHLLRLQSGNKMFQLECSRKPCEIDKKQIELGDTLTLRTEKKWAYVSFVQGSGTKEQKLRILSETEGEAASATR